MTTRTAKAKKSEAEVKAEAAGIVEWAEIVDALPETINPLKLSDEVQMELVAIAASVKDDGAEDAMVLLKELSRVMPRLFVDAEAFEEWRTSIPMFGRLPIYMTIFQHYVEGLGEHES